MAHLNICPQTFNGVLVVDSAYGSPREDPRGRALTPQASDLPKGTCGLHFFSQRDYLLETSGSGGTVQKVIPTFRPALSTLRMGPSSHLWREAFFPSSSALGVE